MIHFDNHVFKGLDDSLRQLFSLLGAMGGALQDLIDILPHMLNEADESAVVRAKAIDLSINDREVEADQLVAATIGKYSAIGEDLRFIIGSIKIAGLLEAQADKIKNCIKRLASTAHPLDKTVHQELSAAIKAVRSMVPLSLEQVVNYTPEMTRQMLDAGSVVQRSYRQTLIHLHQQSSGEDQTRVLLVAKNLDQAADMAIDIMKVGFFIHTGEKFRKVRDAQ
jgi:phosphate uptake regulator